MCEKVCVFMGDAVFLEGILRIIGVHPRGKEGTSGQQRGCELAEITNVTNMAGAWAHFEPGPQDWRIVRKP